MANFVGPRDADDILRDGTVDLTATETIAKTMLGGNRRVAPQSLYVLVPSQAGTSPTLKVTFQSLTDGREIEVTHTQNIDAATTFPFLLELPIPFSNDTSWQVVLTVGGSAGQSFGATEVFIALSTHEAQVPIA